jgi:hypothetical protein
MKTREQYLANYIGNTQTPSRSNPDRARGSALHLVSAEEAQHLRHEIDQGRVPSDLEAKLSWLAGTRLPHHFIEQNSRVFLSLLLAAQEGVFHDSTAAQCERLLRVIAYVRKDDDAIPDFRPDGFVDDLQEVRAANLELASLLNHFKRWRLEHQVPGLWLDQLRRLGDHPVGGKALPAHSRWAAC